MKWRYSIMTTDERWNIYHKGFWGKDDELEDNGFSRSARGVLSKLFEILPEKPLTVIDFGCGRGAWLYVCKELGTVHTVGIDGPWIRETDRKIGIDTFIQHDLEEPVSEIAYFSLAICVEVAEHISHQGAPSLVQSIANNTNTVLFSAAPKGQGGEHHINEQPISYWDKLFAEHGFVRYDHIRPLIKNDNSIDWWYRDNTYIYQRKQ